MFAAKEEEGKGSTGDDGAAATLREEEGPARAEVEAPLSVGQAEPAGRLASGRRRLVRSREVLRAGQDCFQRLSVGAAKEEGSDLGVLRVRGSSEGIGGGETSTRPLLDLRTAGEAGATSDLTLLRRAVSSSLPRTPSRASSPLQPYPVLNRLRESAEPLDNLCALRRACLCQPSALDLNGQEQVRDRLHSLSDLAQWDPRASQMRAPDEVQGMEKVLGRA